jgi:hypothetical protein
VFEIRMYTEVAAAAVYILISKQREFESTLPENSSARFSDGPQLNAASAAMLAWKQLEARNREIFKNRFSI